MTDFYQQVLDLCIVYCVVRLELRFFFNSQDKPSGNSRLNIFESQPLASTFRFKGSNMRHCFPVVWHSVEMDRKT